MSLSTDLDNYVAIVVLHPALVSSVKRAERDRPAKHSIATQVYPDLVNPASERYQCSIKEPDDIPRGQFTKLHSETANGIRHTAYRVRTT